VSWVTVDGFQVTRADDRGINLNGSCTDVEILNNSVSWTCKYGIYVSSSSRVRVASNKAFDNGYHGIMLTTGTTNCTIEDNEGYRNALPAQRAANGLYLYGSSNNVIRRNKWHDNQDTGQHVQSGSNDNISYNNISWNNGDHGFDHLAATGTVHLNDVAYGNYKDGFSIEGASTGTHLANCISSENGLTTNEFDLWVDDASMVGFQSNDNLFWNSTAQVPVKIGFVFYPQVASYAAATGQDTRTIQADPKFFAPATADFRLQGWSPAIDNGNSSDPNWPSQDRDGNSRYDNPSVANTGLGSVKYADRGAIEFRASGRVPTAALTATPSSGAAPLNVTLKASGSKDPDGTSLTYRFDFGDGTSVGPQSSSTATHVFAAGTYQPTVTVMDATGLTGSKSVTVTSNGHIDGAPVLTAPATSAAAENTPLVLGITASDPDGEAITSLTADLTGLPAGHNAVFTPGAGNTSGTLTWTPAFTHAGSYTVRFYAMNAKSDTAVTVITVANTDRAPVVTSPPTATFSAGAQSTVNVTATDPDGDVITSLTANLAGLPAGNTAVFTAGPGNTTGVLTWTPTLAQAGAYWVYFAGTNALIGADTTRITVLTSNQPPVASLVATPSSGAAPLTVTLNGSASSDPDGGTLSYTFEFGDGAVLGPQAQAQTTHVYTSGTYTAKLTVTDPVGATSIANATITVSGSGLGPNLVTNGEFETSLSGWSAYSTGTLARVAGGYLSDWAAQVTSTATTPGSFGFNDSPNWVANAGALGTRYRFSAWVRSESARGTAKLQIREYLGSTKVGATTFSPVVTLSPTWQLLTVDHVSQGAGTTLDFQIYEIPLVLGETFLTDAVSINLITGGSQPVAMNTPIADLSVGVEALQFGARMVPSITSSIATLQFTTTRHGAVRADLFDASGRRVKELLDESDMAPGLHTLNVDGRSERGDRLGAGVYFYRLQATERSVVGRLVFVR
jgi:parallel beta-helix repeat protein